MWGHTLRHKYKPGGHGLGPGELRGGRVAPNVTAQGPAQQGPAWKHYGDSDSRDLAFLLPARVPVWDRPSRQMKELLLSATL